ncbi:hypothetical protein [Georgenia sp. Z1491]|uniref:hypothetical protein n=1 Tax=Georgenia sp. Z1491 TaxID=3416707 RepID=UPI003CE862FF
MPTPQTPPSVPLSVRILQAVCVVQAVALLVVAGGLAADLLSGEAVVRATVVMLVVVYAVLAALLLLGARAAGRGRAAVRGALITWWLLAGVSAVTIDLALGLALAAAATCVVGLVAMFWPDTRRFMRYRRGR